MEEFNSSLSVDWRLYPYDIAGSIAHCTMLAECEIIPAADAELIIKTLKEINADIDSGSLKILGAEDIHMFIEGELTARIGVAGKKLHTARSRNDQVALDMRMYAKNAVKGLVSAVKDLTSVLIKTAFEHINTFMSAYTHMQKAQPVTLGHYLSAYIQMFLRDAGRLNDCFKRINVMPLGACALAGTSYPIDCERVCELLGFSEISANSIDAVSDRDFLIELASVCTQIILHLSRLAEELIYWSSDEFGYIEISEGYSTTSSIMPQKKNPDAAELIRGKSGRVSGALNSLIVMMKGLPLAYNKDMQEDKAAVFDCVDNTLASLKIMSGMMSEVKYNVPSLAKGAAKGFTQATDAADYLVKKGLPFRDAHEIIGRMVKYMVAKNLTFDKLKLSDYKTFSPLFEDDIIEVLKIKNIIAARKIPGGPAPSAVRRALKAVEKELRKL